jgi:hypothetical protein
VRLPVTPVVLALAFGLVAGTALALGLRAALPTVASADGSSLAAAATPSPAPTVAASAAPADPCVGFKQAEVGAGSERASFPARTLSELLANAAKDPWIRHRLEDVAGVRLGPLADPRVPRCRVDLVRFGDPLFLRAFPATTGTWLLPLRYEDATLETLFVSVDEAGLGRLGGGRGGAIPVPTEGDARAAGALPGDPVVSAELIAAKPPGCGADFTAVWRLVRSKGSVAYFALDVFGATPPGVLFEEMDMRFSIAKVGTYAQLPSAC